MMRSIISQIAFERIWGFFLRATFQFEFNFIVFNGQVAKDVARISLKFS